MLTEQQKSFSKILDLVEDAECMPHVVLVGSWAEFAYEKAGLLPGFAPNIKTMDVDFLVRNLRKPTPAVGLSSLARERGFFVESDRLSGVTKIFDMSGLEVEFLIRKLGAGIEPALKTNIGVTAQTLRHMDILLNHVIEVPLLGHLVRVPIPEAYAMHKMIINEERGVKAEKDAHAVKNVLPFLNASKLENLFEQLTKKERTRVKNFAERNELV